MPKAPIYIIGTGLSHNGSAVLLKDGEIYVAIEKERISRIKHDGGNDSQAIQYCLDSAGITLKDISLVVQCANFEIPNQERYRGERLFASNTHPPLISISHHLAHAYSAAGTCPYNECAIMVIDGCGSPIEQCIDTSSGQIKIHDKIGLQCEKDSFYHFDGQKITTLFKDFSILAKPNTNHPLQMNTTKHSIGGFYAAVSNYVFGNLDDVGKLMGLAPYGRAQEIKLEAFDLSEENIKVTDTWQDDFDKPFVNYTDFKANFQYYANVAAWAQNQVEKAVTYCFKSRLTKFPHQNVCYTGGVALNAVANAKLLNEGTVSNLYLEPAAGDNGLALGCAFYGWLAVLGKPKVKTNGNACFGKNYVDKEIEPSEEILEKTALALAAGKTVGWFQGGAEFGPRALGHRSILAHPGIEGLANHINANIKFREDFRPFAPVILGEFASKYFVYGRPSPYMILVDQTKEEYYEILRNVTHIDGSARLQTIQKEWNVPLEKLLRKFYRITGIPVLLNTSFNKKGMPIVELPEHAKKLFDETALDILVINDTWTAK